MADQHADDVRSLDSCKCEWPHGCENRATKGWPTGVPCPHVMICDSHDDVRVGDPAAGALYNLWVERRSAARNDGRDDAGTMEP